MVPVTNKNIKAASIKPMKFVSDYPTVNLFVRKKIFLKVGGFVEDFWPGEDTKFCLDLVKLYGNCILLLQYHFQSYFSGDLILYFFQIKELLSGGMGRKNG